MEVSERTLPSVILWGVRENRPQCHPSSMKGRASMALWGFRPVRPEFEIDDPKKDFRSSQVIEQYHLSGKALYIPDKGFSWRYLPLDKIRGVIPGRVSRDEESAMGGYHIELPVIRVIYQGGVEKLTVEGRRQAEELFELLKKHSEAGRRANPR